MTTKVYVAKYIADPRRWEPRNVGVFVVAEERCSARFLGEDESGRVDRRGVRYRVGDTEAYEQWVGFWRRTVSADKGMDPILAVSTPHYWVAEQGEIWLDDAAASVEDLCRRYFNELVAATEDDVVSIQLQPRVDRLLAETGISKSMGFHRDYVVTSENLDPPEQYRFQYAFKNGSTTVGQRISLGNQPLVHDLLWRFTYLPGVKKVVFVARELEPDGSSALYTHLQRKANVIIDVLQPDAEERALSAFKST